MSEKAIKYRIYPDEKQCVFFAKTFGCCRKVWNLMLADRHNGMYHTPAHYKVEYPYLKEVDSLALANVQINMSTSFKNCYEDHNTNPPKFKSRHHSKKSYTTNCQVPKKGGQPTIRLGDGFIHLPKAGDIKAVLHKIPDDDWELKSATVSQDSAGNYFCSVLFHYEENIKPVSLAEPDDLEALGLDYKSNGLYMDSNGTCADMPKHFRESGKKLARAQRVLSRRVGSKKGEEKSQNWQKQQKTVNKILRHGANQRLDQLHKRSTQIANECDVVCIEDLDMKALSNKSFGNGKAAMDNGWGMFTQMLGYKLADRGKYLIKVGKWFPSSQLCHMCGHRQKMPLHVRTYVCPECGMVCDRDENAAINIRNEGMRILMESAA